MERIVFSERNPLFQTVRNATEREGNMKELDLPKEQPIEKLHNLLNEFGIVDKIIKQREDFYAYLRPCPHEQEYKIPLTYLGAKIFLKVRFENIINTQQGKDE